MLRSERFYKADDHNKDLSISLAFELKIKLRHSDSEGLEQIQRMPELKSKCILVDFTEYYYIWGFVFVLLLEAVISYNEVFYRSLLHPSSEVEGIGFQPVIPSRLLVA
jgi:hypothetical protein